MSCTISISCEISPVKVLVAVFELRTANEANAIILQRCILMCQFDKIRERDETKGM